MVTDSRLATALALHGQVMRIPKAALIFDIGEKADGIYVVRSGQIKVQLLDSEQKSVWSRNVFEYGILGLPAAIGHHPHYLRAIASDNTEVIFVDAATVASLIRDDPKLGGQVLMLISGELADLRRKMDMLRAQLKSDHLDDRRFVELSRTATARVDYTPSS